MVVFDYRDSDGLVLADIRELLYLLVVNAPGVYRGEDHDGVATPLTSFERRRMVSA